MKSNAAEMPSSKNPGAARLSLTATDGLSGLFDLSAQVDSQPMTSTPAGSLLITRLAAGHHVVTYSAIDVAGNQSSGVL